MIHCAFAVSMLWVGCITFCIAILFVYHAYLKRRFYTPCFFMSFFLAQTLALLHSEYQRPQANMLLRTPNAQVFLRFSPQLNIVFAL